MPNTQAGNNIANQLGMPLYGIAGVPPFTGNQFWVDETFGSDGNTGGPQDPLKTLGQAHTLCTAENNDVVFLSGSVHTTATLAWSKNKTHLIGLTAPSQNNRARISQTGSTVFSPLVNVTAQGCIFKNFATFHGFADASTQICWTDSGGRNGYDSVQFLGMGNATAAAQAGSRSLLITGSTGENRFTNCQIGLDTVTRATNANASLELAGASPRNVFTGCVFPMLTSLAGDLFVSIGSGGIDRWVLFDDCFFVNCVDAGGTIATNAITANASAGGSVLLNNSIVLGCTNVSASGPVYVNQISAAGGNTTYIAVAAS